MASDALLTCAACGGGLPQPEADGHWQGACPSCGASTRVDAFPAAYHAPPRGKMGEVRASEEQAACFEHVDRVAETACEVCGRFLCATCRVDLLGKVYCAPCLERAADENTIPGLVQRKDRMEAGALALVGLPLVLASIACAAALLGGSDVFDALALGMAIAVFVALAALPLAIALILLSRKSGGGAKKRNPTPWILAGGCFFVFLMFAGFVIATGIVAAMASIPPPN